MKKILVIGMSDNIGGIETYFHNYYQHLDIKKYHFDFATTCRTIAFADEYRDNGSEIYKLPNFAKEPLRYYMTLRKVIRNGKYDIIHINMLSAANVLPIRASQAEKIPRIIVHSHNTNVPKGVIRKVLHFINRRSLKSSELTRLACSRKAGEWLFGCYANFTILNNAIDLEKFKFNSHERNRVRSQYNILDDDFLIGNIGRLCEQKNQMFLIKSIEQLQDRKIKLMIVGDGEQKDLFESEIRKAKMEDRIILVPNTSKVESFYSAFDIFALPSKFEGLPVSAIEATANGLTCILPDFLSEYGVFANQKFLKIDAPSNWAKVFANDKNKLREDNSNNIKKCGFDASMEYHKLAEAYDG